MKKIKFGLTSFVETTKDVSTNKTISHQVRINEVLNEIKLADSLGIDFYGIGEHHRADFAASAPEILLASATTITKQITLSTAVSVLSSNDPIRLYEQFATMDAIAPKRMEIMAGRGSFIESFELFGYELKDYEMLFEEKLGLLIDLLNKDVVSFNGKSRLPLPPTSVYPNVEKGNITLSIAVGGTRSSVERAARLGLPIVFAIIGGNPLAFKPLIDLYNHLYKEYGHDPAKKSVGINLHGYIDSTFELAKDKMFIPTQQAMNKIGTERGWGSYTRNYFDYLAAENGSMLVGSPKEVTNKIVALYKAFEFDRIMIQMPVGTMKHEDVLNSIKLYATEVIPNVLKAI